MTERRFEIVLHILALAVVSAILLGLGAIVFHIVPCAHCMCG